MMSKWVKFYYFYLAIKMKGVIINTVHLSSYI